MLYMKMNIRKLTPNVVEETDVNVPARPSFSPWTCELCSQEMDTLTGNLTKYFRSFNKFDFFSSFCIWKLLLTLEYQQIWCFWYIFSCKRCQTSAKYHWVGGGDKIWKSKFEKSNIHLTFHGYVETLFIFLIPHFFWKKNPTRAKKPILSNFPRFWL